MSYQNTFRRYELKYLLSRQQAQQIKAEMKAYMSEDSYGKTTIRNLYFDTPSYRLIRHSIEKPVYKEKLRLRSYQRLTRDKPAFVELKKKFNGVVYKRRLAMPEEKAILWLSGRENAPPSSQIGQEIDYFCRYYENLQPVIYLCYDRVAWYSLDGSDFRVTFDENILCRQESLCLQSEAWGQAILPEDKVLMEIKSIGSIPLWMVRLLSDGHIYKTSFSKYGTAYEKLIFPTLKGVFL